MINDTKKYERYDNKQTNILKNDTKNTIMWQQTNEQISWHKIQTNIQMKSQETNKDWLQTKECSPRVHTWEEHARNEKSNLAAKTNEKR